MDDFNKSEDLFEIILPRARQYRLERKQKEEEQELKIIDDGIKLDAEILKERRLAEYEKECEEKKRLKMSPKARLAYDLKKIEEEEQKLLRLNRS